MTKTINIWFDADGVLFDTETFQLSTNILEYMQKKHNLKVVNQNGNRIKDIFNCSEEIELDCWKHVIIKYSLFYKTRPWIKETIDCLRKEGHKVYIITSKACALDKNINGLGVRFLFELGLKLRSIKVDGIEYCSLINSGISKLNACKKRNIGIMVEDTKENIIHLSRELPVLCVETLDNMNEQFNANVYKVLDGNGIYANLKKIISTLKEENIYTQVSLQNKEEKEKMEIEEKSIYFDKLIDYYKYLPYNEKKIKQGELIIRILAHYLSIFFEKKYNPIIINRENLPKERRIIYISNHLCNKDMIFILSELHGLLYEWHPLIKEEILKEPIGKIFEIANSIFVERQNQKSRYIAMQELAKHLSHGQNVLIFPEATYNRNYPNQNLKNFEGKSHVYLSQLFQKPIVPLALTNDYTKSPILRIGTPFIIPRNISLEDAQTISYNVLDNLVEENKKLILTKGNIGDDK